MTIDYTKPAEEIAEDMLRYFKNYVSNWTTISKPNETPRAIFEIGQKKGRAIQCSLTAVNLQLQVCPKTDEFKGWNFSNDKPVFKPIGIYAKLQEVKQVLENKLK